MGIHPSTFYRWKRQLDRHGPEILRPRERRPPRMANQTSVLVEQRVVAFALGHPGFGPARIAAELARPKWGGSGCRPMGCGGCCAAMACRPEPSATAWSLAMRHRPNLRVLRRQSDTWSARLKDPGQAGGHRPRRGRRDRPPARPRQAISLAAVPAMPRFRVALVGRPNHAEALSLCLSIWLGHCQHAK